MAQIDKDVWEHWQENLQLAKDGKLRLFNIMGASCAYCQRYFTNEGAYADCSGCPIQKYTGVADCEDTPWCDLYAAVPSIHGNKTKVVTAVKRQIEFLAKVVPADDQESRNV